MNEPRRVSKNDALNKIYSGWAKDNLEPMRTAVIVSEDYLDGRKSMQLKSTGDDPLTKGFLHGYKPITTKCKRL